MNESKIVVIPIGFAAGEDDQTARIQENVREYQDNWQDYTSSDFEEIFEDRDPCEFL